MAHTCEFLYIDNHILRLEMERRVPEKSAAP
jgi:hypothetical protein